MELQINHVENFFDLVDQGEYTNIEVYNYVDRLTDNFKVEKLKIFLGDIDGTISHRRQEYLAEYSTLLPSTLRSYKALGRTIPFQIVNGKQVPDAGKIYGAAISSNLYCLYEVVHNWSINEEDFISRNRESFKELDSQYLAMETSLVTELKTKKIEFIRIHPELLITEKERTHIKCII